MKKTLLTAAAAIALVSCSQDNLLENGGYESSNAIAFDSYLGKSAQTRATVVDKESLKTEGFGVNAYYNEGTDKEVFMKNTKVTFNGEDEKGNWVYSPVKYWPNNDGDELSFYAYGPYNNKNITVNETDFTELGFTVNNKVLDQVDFIYNDQVENPTLNLIKPTVNEKVSFKFQHALSRIGFTVQVVVDETDKEKSYKLDGNTHINVKEVEIIGNNDASFYESGTLDMSATGTWKDVTGSQNFTFTGDNFYRTVKVDDKEVVQLHKFNQKQSLLNEKSYLMIIPQDFTTDGFNIKITYDVITEGENGDNSTITNEITSETPLQINFEQGKAYNFNLILGMTSVKFDVDDVVAWEDATDDDYEDDHWFNENVDEFTTEIEGLTYSLTKNVFYIASAEDLNKVAELINGNGSYTVSETRSDDPLNFVDATYYQTADITFTEDNLYSKTINNFKGKYNGNGKTISGLDKQFISTLNGTLEDLHLDVNLNTNDGAYKTSSVGNNRGTINKCSVAGTVVSNQVYTGALVCNNYGTIIGCWNEANLEISNIYIGGIVGYNYESGKVIACYNKGNICGSNLVGGIAGINLAEIYGCYNIGMISFNKDNSGNACGIVGWTDQLSDTPTIACYNTGSLYSEYNNGLYPITTGYSGIHLIESNYWAECGQTEDILKGITKVDGTEVTWETAMTNMNQALSECGVSEVAGWHYVLNTDEATKATEPLKLEYTAQ